MTFDMVLSIWLDIPDDSYLSDESKTELLKEILQRGADSYNADYELHQLKIID